MRDFAAQDGRVWKARLDHALGSPIPEAKSVGWEAILFETIAPASQKLVYRPAGWLLKASLSELNHALLEAEAVRARWQNSLLA